LNKNSLTNQLTYHFSGGIFVSFVHVLVHCAHNTLSMNLVTHAASCAGALSLCLAMASATFTSEPHIGTCDPGIAEKEGNNCQGCPAGTETTHQSLCDNLPKFP
jgi:hypothetical protein